MVAVVFACIFALIGIGGLAVGALTYEKAAGYGVGVAALVLAGIIVVAGSATTVAANHVGVVTAFGQYRGVIPAGFHWLNPVADVEEFGTRVQPLEMQNVGIRFKGNSGGEADLLVEWRIEASNEDEIRRLWSDYRTFDAIQNRVVQSNTRNALNVVLAGYTPSEGVAGTALQPIMDATVAALQARLEGTGVVVERVTIRQIDPDPGSRDRINLQVQAQADLERTATTRQIAEQEAQIAAIRQQSQTPSSLVYECLRIVADWDQSRQGPIPSLLDCSLSGQAPPVIVGR